MNSRYDKWNGMNGSHTHAHFTDLWPDFLSDRCHHSHSILRMFYLYIWFCVCFFLFHCFSFYFLFVRSVLKEFEQVKNSRGNECVHGQNNFAYNGTTVRNIAKKNMRCDRFKVGKMTIKFYFPLSTNLIRIIESHLILLFFVHSTEIRT